MCGNSIYYPGSINWKTDIIEMALYLAFMILLSIYAGFWTYVSFGIFVSIFFFINRCNKTKFPLSSRVFNFDCRQRYPIDSFISPRPWSIICMLFKLFAFLMTTGMWLHTKEDIQEQDTKLAELLGKTILIFLLLYPLSVFF